MADVPLWAAFALPAVGYLAAVVTETLRDRRAERQEVKREERARRQAVEDRRADFERKSLMDLYDALRVLLPLAARLHTTPGQGSSGEAFEAFRSASVEAARLAHLVMDDDLRTMVEVTLDRQYTAFRAATDEERSKVAANGILAAAPTLEAIAARIRSLYAEL